MGGEFPVPGTPALDASETGVAACDSPDTDEERMRLLAVAAAPRVVALAGAIFDRTTSQKSHLLKQVRSCLCVGLSACAQDRPFNGSERENLLRVGQLIARSGGRPPSLVGVHSVLLLGHNEVLRSCQELPIAAHLAQQLGGGAKRLGEISEEMASCIEEGYTRERFAPKGDIDKSRPIDALCALITEQPNSWRRPCLAKVVQDSGLSSMFPAVMAIASGQVAHTTAPTVVPIGRSGRLIVAPLTEPEPHTLILCPAESAGRLTTWLRRNVATSAVYTRAVTFDEAPARYASTRNLLSSGGLPDDAHIVDAGKLLWQRMLASQRIEFVRDYAEEVIGPILRLPKAQQASLLTTLDSRRRCSLQSRRPKREAPTQLPLPVTARRCVALGPDTSGPGWPCARRGYRTSRRSRAAVGYLAANVAMRSVAHQCLFRLGVLHQWPVRAVSVMHEQPPYEHRCV
jgi:hypothetical protein